MKNRTWLNGASGRPALTAAERETVVRETFEAITTVGFMKWKAEELMGYGYLVTEEDRRHFFREFEKDHFAEFGRMASAAPDAGLLDSRDYWIEKARTMGPDAWQEVLSAGRGATPFYESVAREVAERGGREG
jgi:hypothetical protein